MTIKTMAEKTQEFTAGLYALLDAFDAQIGELHYGDPLANFTKGLRAVIEEIASASGEIPAQKIPGMISISLIAADTLWDSGWMKPASLEHSEAVRVLMGQLIDACKERSMAQSPVTPDVEPKWPIAVGDEIYKHLGTVHRNGTDQAECIEVIRAEPMKFIVKYADGEGTGSRHEVSTFRAAMVKAGLDPLMPLKRWNGNTVRSGGSQVWTPLDALRDCKIKAIVMRSRIDGVTTDVDCDISTLLTWARKGAIPNETSYLFYATNGNVLVRGEMESLHQFDLIIDACDDKTVITTWHFAHPVEWLYRCIEAAECVKGHIPLEDLRFPAVAPDLARSLFGLYEPQSY